MSLCGQYPTQFVSILPLHYDDCDISSVCLPAVVLLLDIRVTKRENKRTGNKGVILRLGVEYRWRTVIIGIAVRRSEVLWLNSFLFFIFVTAD